MTPEERERMLEELSSAWRPRDRTGKTLAHPAWHDLDLADRQEAARRAEETRRLEAALDDDGLTTTTRAVLGRIRGDRGD